MLCEGHCCFVFCVCWFGLFYFVDIYVFFYFLRILDCCILCRFFAFFVFNILIFLCFVHIIALSCFVFWEYFSWLVVFCADHCCFVFCILSLLYFVQIIVDRGVKDGLQALLVLSVHSHCAVSGREHWAEPSQWQRTTSTWKASYCLCISYMLRFGKRETIVVGIFPRFIVHSHLAPSAN